MRMSAAYDRSIDPLEALHLDRLRTVGLDCGCSGAHIDSVVQTSRGEPEYYKAGELHSVRNRRAFWAWPVLVVYLAYATLSQLKYSHGRPLGLMIAVCLGILLAMVLFPFPGNDSRNRRRPGADSWSWKNKQIRWADIVEINTGEKVAR
jgi:hypothetical protein